MLTHVIFIRPDSELIRESVCACAKLFVDEENVGCAQIVLHEIDTFVCLKGKQLLQTCGKNV
jgi:hypothetical protein